jgi:hypothetical protein
MASFRRTPLVQRMTLRKEGALLPVSNLTGDTLVINHVHRLRGVLGFDVPATYDLLRKRNVGEELPW